MAPAPAQWTDEEIEQAIATVRRVRIARGDLRGPLAGLHNAEDAAEIKLARAAGRVDSAFGPFE